MLKFCAAIHARDLVLKFVLFILKLIPYSESLREGTIPSIGRPNY